MLRRALVSSTVIALSVLSVAATACGSSSSSSPASPCGALTVAQLRSITGLEFRDGRDRSIDRTTNDSSLCVWTSTDGTAEVALSRGSKAAKFDDAVSDASASFGSERQISVEGATRAVEFGDFGVVIMQIGDRVEVLQESLPGATVGTHLELAAQVAKNA